MFAILAAYDIPSRILNVIKEMYRNMKAKVKSPDGDTEYFQIFARVMQGYTLGPFLFVILLDYAMRQAIEGKEEQLSFTLHRKQSRRVYANAISDLDWWSLWDKCKENQKSYDSQVIITDGGIQINQALVESTGEQDLISW